jgi:zinc transporter ZupT
MSESKSAEADLVARGPRSPGAVAQTVLWLVVPLVLLGLAGAWLFANDPAHLIGGGAPPVEGLTFERRVLDDQGIHLKIRTGGSEPMEIAQIQVDGAYWQFTQEPPGALPRLGSAWLHIPYPWVVGEAHVVNVLTRTGAAFEHTIDVAVTTPEARSSQLLTLTIIGAFVGPLPVALGLLFYVPMRRLGRRGLDFVLALTCGMLAFLLVDMVGESIELADKAAPAFQGAVGVLLIATLACLGLLALGRRHGSPEGVALAWFMALGIGIHNFGEGLAIGAALAAGAAGLGAFLVLGFTLHNITEGIGIAAPLLRTRSTFLTFVGLTVLAGAPAIPGVWAGSFAIAPHWAAFALAIGAGAIAQVLFEIGAYILRAPDPTQSPLRGSVLGGLLLGVAVMFVTALLIKV